MIYMKKINSILVSLVAVAALFLASCAGASKPENVFDKKISAYNGAVEKVLAAKEISELNGINEALENEIAGIEELCADELNKVFEEKAVNVDAYKSDEDSLKKAQTAYDDAYISRYLELADAAAPQL